MDVRWESKREERRVKNFLGVSKGGRVTSLGELMGEPGRYLSDPLPCLVNLSEY